MIWMMTMTGVVIVPVATAAAVMHQPTETKKNTHTATNTERKT